VTEEQPMGWPTTCLAPGKPLRFTVVDGDNGSATWRAWTGKDATTNDIYLMERVSGRRWKVSMHDGWGTWRIAETREGADEGAERRVVDSWQAPSAENGWREAVGVLVPVPYLRKLINPLPVNIIQIPISPAHSAIAIRLLIEDPGAPGALFRAGYPVGCLTRPDGGRIYVIAEPASLSSDNFQTLAEMRDSARTQLPETTDDPYGRFIGVLQLTPGERILVDLCCG
jgi:hypothetical protein